MAIPTTTLVKLVSIGLSAEQAEAVAVMLREVEDATKAEAAAPLEARKAADRKRKQDERERGKIISGHVTSAEVTSCPRNSAPSADTASDPIETVFSKSEITPSSPPKGGSVSPKKPKKPVGTLCPEDLRPQDSHYAKCQQRDAPPSLADESCRAMIDWSHERANEDIAWKADWHRALHRWLDRDIERFHERRRGSRQPTRGSPQPRTSTHGPLSLLASLSEASHDPSEHDHFDQRTIDHDPRHGGSDRALHEQAGGAFGRAGPDARLRVIGSSGR